MENRKEPEPRRKISKRELLVAAFSFLLIAGSIGMLLPTATVQVAAAQRSNGNSACPEGFEKTARGTCTGPETLINDPGACDDLIDNDGDGLIDQQDPDCQNGGSEIQTTGCVIGNSDGKGNCITGRGGKN
jgi:hypothetical protein